MPSPLGVSRVALDLRVPTCRRHYPGGPLGSDRSWTAYSTRFPIHSPATAAFPIRVRGWRPHWSFRGRQRSLALRPVGSLHRLSDTFVSRSRRFRYLHRRSDSYRLERPSCRVGIAPTEDQHLFTVHTRSDPKSPDPKSPQADPGRDSSQSPGENGQDFVEILGTGAIAP